MHGASSVSSEGKTRNVGWSAHSWVHLLQLQGYYLVGLRSRFYLGPCATVVHLSNAAASLKSQAEFFLLPWPCKRYLLLGTGELWVLPLQQDEGI